MSSNRETEQPEVEQNLVYKHTSIILNFMSSKIKKMWSYTKQTAEQPRSNSPTEWDDEDEQDWGQFVRLD